MFNIRVLKNYLFDFIIWISGWIILFYFISLWFTAYNEKIQEDQFWSYNESSETWIYIIPGKQPIILANIDTSFLEKDILFYKNLLLQNSIMGIKSLSGILNMNNSNKSITEIQDDNKLLLLLSNIKDKQMKESENEQKQKELIQQQLDLKEEQDFWYQQDNWANIVIPSIKLKVDFITQLDNADATQIENSLKQGAVLYPWSVPWDYWLPMIFSHSSQYPAKKFYSFFYKLEEVPITWSKIYINNDKYSYEYETVSSETIPPEEIENIKIDKSQQSIALVTCTPIWTSKDRYILFAKLIKKTRHE